MGCVEEGVQVRYELPDALGTELAALDRPWIADEGPCDVGFRRGPGGEPPRFRGLAFDARVTITWDEAGVQVAEPAPAQAGVVALRSPVLVREGYDAPAELVRIDYLCRGALVASRYTFSEKGGGDA